MLKQAFPRKCYDRIHNNISSRRRKRRAGSTGRATRWRGKRSLSPANRWRHRAFLIPAAGC
ncbi:hypothetical protein EGH57_25760, partial [Klebsiella aerogenes]